MYNPQPSRLSLFKRPRVLIVGCGDVGLRVAKLLRGNCRLMALTSQTERVPALRAQGIVPAPESTHAIAACAAAVADSDVEQVVVIGLSGHGQLDLPAYAEFLDGKF